MNVQTLREPAAAGDPVPRTQASSLDILASERAICRNGGSGRRGRPPVDQGFPGTSRHDIIPITATGTGLIEFVVWPLAPGPAAVT